MINIFHNRNEINKLQTTNQIKKKNQISRRDILIIFNKSELPHKSLPIYKRISNYIFILITILLSVLPTSLSNETNHTIQSDKKQRFKLNQMGYLNKFPSYNISLKWSANVQSELIINSLTQKVEHCSTKDRTLNKLVDSTISFNALSKLIQNIPFKNQTMILIEQPSRQFNISVDISRIYLNGESKLLGGGCATSNNNNSKNNNKRNNTPQLAQKRLININPLDDLCNEDDLPTELAKVRSIDLEGQVFPFFNKIMKKDQLDILNCNKLLKVLMHCLEFTLIDTRMNQTSHNNTASYFNQNTIKIFKNYIKRLQDQFNTKKEKYPLESHMIILKWLSMVLKFDKKEQQILASNCTDQDCLLFSMKFDSAATGQIELNESFISDGDDLIERQSPLFIQKNPIFHLIAYRKIISRNFASCAGSLPTIMDQLIFAHHKSFNKLKSKLGFDARFYSLFSIDQLLSTLNNPTSFSNTSESKLSENRSIYANTFLFSKEEGLISICEGEFKLRQNNGNSNESVSEFLAHHQSFRFIASDILKKVLLIISNYLPSNEYNEQQQKYVTELINQRSYIEKSSCVKIIFSENYLNLSPISQHTNNNLAL